MSQTGAGSPTGGPGQAQAIPTPKGKVSQPYHWWFDRHQTGVYNSSPPSAPMFANSPPGGTGGSFSASSSPGTSYGSPPSHSYSTSPPDPKVAIPMPAPGEEMKFRDYFRRGSLNMSYLLDDFGTPPE